MDPAVLERLWDVPLRDYAVAALKIVDKDGELVTLDCTGRPGQIKLSEAIERQKAAGRPVRIILVKSRQFGGSTLVQAELAAKRQRELAAGDAGARADLEAAEATLNTARADVESQRAMVAQARINVDTAPDAARAGVDILVAGSAVFHAPDPLAAARAIRAAAEAAIAA